jgi:ubiquinone/menaquinone biosynthesis C-methylase UbiE
LDVGCGTGFLLKIAAEAGAEVFGVDISQAATEVAKKQCPTARIEAAAAESLPWEDNFFDYVVCLGSMEHFDNLEKGIKEMIRVTKQDAKFLLVVPNKDYFFWQFKKQKGTHQRGIKEQLYNFEEWRNIFLKQGLKILEIKSDYYPTRSLPWFCSFNPLKIFKRLAFKMVWLILPLKYGYQFIITAKK